MIVIISRLRTGCNNLNGAPQVTGKRSVGLCDLCHEVETSELTAYVGLTHTKVVGHRKE